MKPLVCDMCGGSLTMDKSGDFAVCEYCGMKHTRERIQVKVQEIKGTVHVDGPIEIVNGNAEKERLLSSAETHYSLGNYKESNEIFLQITKQYPSNFYGWFGLYKSNLQYRFNSKDIIISYGGKIEDEFKYIDENELNYQYAKKFWTGTEQSLEKLYIDLWKTIPFYEIRMPIYRKISLKNAAEFNHAIDNYIENEVKKCRLFKKKYVARGEIREKVSKQFTNSIFENASKKFNPTGVLLFNGKSIACLNVDDSYSFYTLNKEIHIKEVIIELENNR